ncbi:MAG: tyrosine--tRNA ligase [Candidatus Symbiodolus clandestinus]
MATQHFLEELQQRGMIAQITDLSGLVNRLEQGPIAFYCGFDPTGDSLHLGHLVPLLCLQRFQRAGHHPIILVGGATGLVGDPSFKAQERQLNTPEIVDQWSTAIGSQASRFVNFGASENSAKLLNNAAWFQNLNALAFLRDIGKHFSVNAMINKESVRQRLTRPDQGISFTEFSYSLLQAYDFAVLQRDYAVELQIGGSDQWGNITAGIELTRRLFKKTVYGLTVPLVTKADGSKFGKSESGNIWLDPQKTSPYRFYQYWLNVADADVYRFLALFTLLPLEEIQALQSADQISQKSPQAQLILAQWVTQLVHGSEALKAAQRISETLFSGDVSQLTAADFSQLAQDGIPVVTLSGNLSLAQVLVMADLAPSQGQARSLISAQAISINGKKGSEAHYEFTEADRCYGRYTLLKRGKKQYCLLCWKDK